MFFEKTLYPEGPLPQSVRDNIKRAELQAEEQGINVHREPIVIDVDASKAKMTWRKGISPCLTRSRYRGHWLSSKNRRMNIDEMLRLQGMKPNLLNTKGISTIELGHQIGNAMSVNVIQRILQQVLLHIGKIKEPVQDEWERGLQTTLQPNHQRIVGRCSSRGATGKLRKLRR